MQVSKKDCNWNLSPLLKGDDDPQISSKRKEIGSKNYQFIKKWKKRRDYLSNSKVLKKALDEYEVLQKSYSNGGDEGYYFYLRTSQDENDPKLKAKNNQVTDFMDKIQNDLRFFELKLAKIPTNTQKTFLINPDLKQYKHFLEKLFKSAKYLLSDPEEKIMNLKVQTSHNNWVKMTSGFLAKEEREVVDESGKKIKKTYTGLLSLFDSKNKKVRDTAALAFNDILRKYLEVAEAELNSILANKKIDDELRKMPRPDFSRHLLDDIDSKTVDTLVSSVVKRFGISKHYYQLLAKMLGVKKIAYHERNISFSGKETKYSWNYSVDLVLKTFQELDPKFSEIMERFLKNCQVDIFPQKGKCGGAYCSYNLLTQPTYILLNHTENLNDVLTLAHEMGHGVNNELMREKQNSLNFGTPLSTAEVASTLMEDFVLQTLLEKADENQQLSIMMMKLNRDMASIFRQIACYRFEQELHQLFRKKGYLSKEEIGKLFQKHMSSYMGTSVEQSPGSQNWWVYWSHIRRFFYNYSYANGLLISKYLQSKVRENPQFTEKVKEFLSAGTSDSPENIFRKMKIDITDEKFWNQGLDEVDSLLKETEKLAKKLGRI